MKERKMTVYKGQGAFKEAPPQILLQGRWLEQAGFNAGDKITVDCKQGGLSLQRTSHKQIPKRDNRRILIFYGEFLCKLIPFGKTL